MAEGGEGRRGFVDAVFSSPFVCVLLVAAFSTAVYANTLSNGFVYDDNKQILENWWIRDFRNIPAFFTSHSWGFREDKVSNYYRPMMHVLYAAVYYSFGLKPWAYHLLNVVLHAAVSTAAFMLFTKLFAVSGQAAGCTAGQRKFAFFGALLFAAHPVHSEVVAWVSGMVELEAMLFGLGAFYLYVKSDGGWDRRYWISVALSLFALLTKETAAGIFLLIAAYDYCFKDGLKFRRYAAYAAVFVFYLVMRMNALGGFAHAGASQAMTGYESLVNVFLLFVSYLWKLLLPISLNVYHVFERAHSFADWRAAGALILTVGYIGLAVVLRGGYRFALIATAVPLLPVMYLPVLTQPVFAERYLYLPSFGFSFGLALVMAWLSGRSRRLEAIAAAAAVMVTAAYCIGAVSRNALWRDNATLWGDAVLKSPGAAAPRGEFGRALVAAGQVEEGKAELLEAARMDPYSAMIRNNLAEAYKATGRLDEALEQYRAAIRLAPGNGLIRYNAAVIYYEKGMIAEAERELVEAAKVSPGNARLRSKIGEEYLKRGRTEEALREFEAAVKGEPSNADFHYNLGNVYAAKGRRGDAFVEYKEALRLEPGYAEARNNIALIYAGRNEFEAAIAEFKAAAEIDKWYIEPRHNLAVIYAKTGRDKEAAAELEAIRRIEEASKKGDKTK